MATTNPVRKVEVFKMVKAQLTQARVQLAVQRGQDLQQYPDLATQIDNQFQSVDDALADRLAAIDTKIANAKAAITDADRIAYAKENEAIASS